MFGGFTEKDRQLLQTLVTQMQTSLKNESEMMRQLAAMLSAQNSLLKATMKELTYLQKILSAVSSPKSPGPVASLRVELGKAVNQ